MSDKRRFVGPKAIRAVMKRIERGRLDPGERILPREIARNLGTSDIPVREAFHQLVGRGALTERYGEGFYAATLNSAALCTFYMAHSRVVDALLRQWNADIRIGGRIATPWRLFNMLADHGEDEALSGIQHYISDRLTPARRHEPAHVAYDIVTRRMASALHNGDKLGARRASRDFHRACTRQASGIWRAMMDK